MHRVELRRSHPAKVPKQIKPALSYPAAYGGYLDMSCTSTTQSRSSAGFVTDLITNSSLPLQKAQQHTRHKNTIRWSEEIREGVYDAFGRTMTITASMETRGLLDPLEVRANHKLIKKYKKYFTAIPANHQLQKIRFLLVFHVYQTAVLIQA